MTINISTDDISGEIVKDNDTYVLEDNTSLSRLTVSKTTLHVGKETRGHKHDNIEEVYYFVSGNGTMDIGESNFNVSSGSIMLIPDGNFHKVYNTGDCDLIFIAMFEKYNKR